MSGRTQAPTAGDASPPGLGMAHLVSQIHGCDLAPSPGSPVTGGRRWPLLSDLGRPRDGPRFSGRPRSDQLASRPVQEMGPPWQSTARARDASSSTARPTTGACAIDPSTTKHPSNWLGTAPSVSPRASLLQSPRLANEIAPHLSGLAIPVGCRSLVSLITAKTP